MSDPSPPLIDFSSISHFLKNKLKGPKTVFLDKNTPVLLAKKRLVAGEIPPPSHRWKMSQIFSIYFDYLPKELCIECTVFCNIGVYNYMIQQIPISSTE